MKNIFIILSLSINIIVLILVCSALLFYDKSHFVINAWGKSSPSRNILLSVYLSILFMSVILLFFYKSNDMIVSLLLFQIIYKLLTSFTLNIRNPIVISNLFIATFHIITIFFIWKEK